MIVTKSYQNNAGMIKDVIASQILSIVSPNVRDNPIQIVSGQVFDTKLFTDVEQTGLNDGEKKVINRILSIRHQIKLEANSNVLNNIYFGTQSTNADPVDFSNIANVNPTLPLSIDYGTQDAPIFFWLAVNSTFSVKTDWDDLNDDGNSGKIGADTDLFEIRDITIDSVPYKLYITRYETGFNGVSAQVRYY